MSADGSDLQRKSITVEKSKQYFESIYTSGPKFGSAKIEQSGKRAFVTRRKIFQEMIESPEKKEDKIPQIEKDPEIVPEIPIIIPNLPKIPNNEVIVEYQRNSENFGISSLNQVSQKMKNDLDFFDDAIANVFINISRIERVSTDCHHFSELNRALSKSALKQLSEIQTYHAQGTFINKLWSYAKSFF